MLFLQLLLDLVTAVAKTSFTQKAHYFLSQAFIDVRMQGKTCCFAISSCDIMLWLQAMTFRLHDGHIRFSDASKYVDLTSSTVRNLLYMPAEFSVELSQSSWGHLKETCHNL
ncbi:hypothetical protein DPMN_121471 [Dreissena polymorpha]|uniref:Uncharacterized protein n=1 Tax=Dreissena polymorpha TaxID=45954 RepID=A0A9D4GMT4_DREPO|nr:hypothetical protein DPMN_121471 [Dreissena polymorpha]